jgi:hypothetical protein
MKKAGLCGLTIFHRLTTFGLKKWLKSGQTIFHRLTTFDLKKWLKSGQTMKNRQTTSRSIVKKVSNRELLMVVRLVA